VVLPTMQSTTTGKNKKQKNRNFFFFLWTEVKKKIPITSRRAEEWTAWS
jgi:hypothetical protein